jgi:hypothetical protein
MNDERVLGIRKLPDGEELVAYTASAAPGAVGGKIPLVASAERRRRALAERSFTPATPWQSKAVAAPAPR